MIPFLPEIPSGIKTAFEQGKLVIFIGAGISRLLGCESWDSLSNNLINICCNYGEAQQITSANLSSKEKITMAYEKVKKSPKEQLFWARFSKSLSVDDKKDGPDIYEKISRLNTLFVTTNADGLMERWLPSNAWSTYCTKESIENVAPPYLFYLHGRYGDGQEFEQASLVFTVNSYLTAYADKKRLDFLRTLFDYRTVLFLGYGLNEFEILDHLFIKSKQSVSTEIRHYILEGFCSFEEALRNAKEQYYGCLGIELVPYNKDNKGFEQQTLIIDNWVNTLLNTSTYNAIIIKNISSIISEFTPDNLSRLKYYLLADNRFRQTYLSVALREIPNTNECYNWLSELWTSNIVSEQHLPPIIVMEKGHMVQSWNFLDCLYKCLLRDSLDILQVFASNVIASIINKAFSSNEYMRNSALMQQIVKIIIKLKSPHIIDLHISFLQRWIELYPETAKSSFVDVDLNWLAWPHTYVDKIIDWILKPLDTNHPASYNYWGEKFKTVLIPELSYSQLENLIMISTKYLYLVEKDTAFYEDFETRFNMYEQEYSKNLVEIIGLALDKIPDEVCISMIKCWASEANSILKIQLTLYYATKFNVDQSLLNCFKYNPLNYEKTNFDLYYYLEKLVILKVTFLDSIIEKLNDWISSATFGLENLAEDNINMRSPLGRYMNQLECSYKLQFYKLLKNVSASFQTEYRRLSRKVKIKWKHPREIAETRVPKSIPYVPERIFADHELDKLSLNDMLDLAQQKAIAHSMLPRYHRALETYSELIEYVAKSGKLDELFERVPFIDIDKIESITRALSKPELSELVIRDNIVYFVESIIQRLYNEPYSENRVRCSRNIVYILQVVQNKNWKNESIIDLCISIDKGNLWPMADEVEQDPSQHIVSLIINNPESQLYNVMIQCACNVRQSESTARLLKYLEACLDRNPRLWFLLSMAYNIQNLFFLDYEWASKRVGQIITSMPSIENYTIVTICRNMKYIVKEISDILVDGNRMVNVIDAFSVKSRGANQYRYDIMQYIVSAYEFGQINERKYTSLLEVLKPSDFNSLFGCIISKKNGELDHSKENTVLLTYQVLKSRYTNGELTEAVLYALKSIDTLSQKHWAMVEESMSNLTSTIWWYGIEQLFEKPIDSYYSEIPDIIVTAINKLGEPEVEFILRILSYLKSHKRFDECKVVCNEMIRNDYHTEVMSAYLDTIT